MARAKRKKSGATFGSRTDVGCVREHNEDSLAVAPPLYVVCDGMGGHAAGEVASEIAVDVICDRAPAHPDASALGQAETIGRESKNDIVIPDINVSRVHAEIRQDESGAWILTDLGSTNGTFVNGRQIKSTALHDADRIIVGTTNLEFQLI